jgi:putative hydrolase of the HAD superfamily
LLIPITTILFDLDDTLFDHAGTARAALAAMATGRAALQGVPVEELYGRYSELLEELHAQVMSGRISYLEARQQRFARLLAPYKPAATATESRQLSEHYYGHYQQLRRPVAGALALLQALKPGYKLGIVTNNRLAEQQEKLRYLGMSELVDALITSEEVGAPTSSDPRIYQVALERLGAEATQTVMVGDNWTADVVGALAVGIRPVWLNRTGAVRPLSHVAEITSLEPLAEVLRQLSSTKAG